MSFLEDGKPKKTVLKMLTQNIAYCGPKSVRFEEIDR